MTGPPRALPCYGGKSAMNRHSKVGRWLARTMPVRQVYVEPCGGMLGVLLQRPPCYTEIANDSDGRLINWWRCVRDASDDFLALIENTPRSEQEFDRARRALAAAEVPADMSDPDAAPDLALGLDTHIVIADSMMHGLGIHGTMAVDYHHGGGRGVPEVERLADRLRKVQLLNRDMTDILRKTASNSNTVIYCDPPYGPGADTTPYGRALPDKEKAATLLREQTGFVAVSGYDDDWDCLRWPVVKDFPAIYTGAGPNSDTTTTRLERVWLNAPPTTGLF